MIDTDKAYAIQGNDAFVDVNVVKKYKEKQKQVHRKRQEQRAHTSSQQRVELDSED